MRSIYTQFADTARANGLILAPGGDGTPGRATASSPIYGRILESTRRMRDTRHALTRGQTVGGQRIDSAGKDCMRDAAHAAHCLEWAGYFAQADHDQRRGPAGMRSDAATIDTIATEIATGRFDALVPMGSQGLTTIMPEVYEYKHANLSAWDGAVLPIDKTSVDPAAENYTWYEFDNVGVARAASTYAMQSIPLVAGPAAQANRLGLVIPFLIGMETNFMEARREALGVRNGKPDFQIERRKVEMCHRAIAEAVNSLWLYGDPLAGIDGLWTSPDIATITITGSWLAGKTSAAILQDLVTIFTTIPNSTQGSPVGGLPDLKKVKLKLPPAQFYLVSSQIMSAAGSESVLSYFLKTFQLPADAVTMNYEFAAANSQIYIGGPFGLSVDHALVTYECNDGWDAAFVMPQMIEMPAPPRQTGMGETTFYHARVGGMRVADARRMRYVVGM